MKITAVIKRETYRSMTTEKMKAKAGLLYDANYDETLLRERTVCADLIHELNLIRPSNQKERDTLLRRILGQTKENFTIISPFFCDYGYNIEIGNNFFMNMNCVILDDALVTFGDNVFVAPNCGFYAGGHPLDAERRNSGLEYAFPIHVGNNVWIGANVCVLPGVTIGDNSVIGAGSIVTKDIPSGVLAYGNPCRVIRTISEDDKKRYTVI